MKKLMSYKEEYNYLQKVWENYEFALLDLDKTRSDLKIESDYCDWSVKKLGLKGMLKLEKKCHYEKNLLKKRFKAESKEFASYKKFMQKTDSTQEIGECYAKLRESVAFQLLYMTMYLRTVRNRMENESSEMLEFYGEQLDFLSMWIDKVKQQFGYLFVFLDKKINGNENEIIKK